MKRFFLVSLLLALIFTMPACYANRSVKDTINTTDEHSNNQAQQFDVVFKDADGNILKSETVEKGQSATPPLGPTVVDDKVVNWDKPYSNITEDTVITTVFKEISDPTLIADTVYAEGENVVVKVSLKKNPGLLSLLINTIYVENAMELTKVESGEIMKDYTFVAPKKLANACNAAWYTIDVPSKVSDGTVALLHFKIKEGAAPGRYKIAIACENGAFNGNCEEVKLEIINGYVVIEDVEATK